MKIFISLLTIILSFSTLAQAQGVPPGYDTTPEKSSNYTNKSPTFKKWIQVTNPEGKKYWCMYARKGGATGLEPDQEKLAKMGMPFKLYSNLAQSDPCTNPGSRFDLYTLDILGFKYEYFKNQRFPLFCSHARQTKGVLIGTMKYCNNVVDEVNQLAIDQYIQRKQSN